MQIQTVKLGEIILDQNNPRFGEEVYQLSETELIAKLLRKRESKELISSMKLGLVWNPFIVVQEMDEDEQLKYDAKYKVVEGNTRIAILKSHHMSEVDENFELPVQIIKEEDFVSKEDFQNLIAKIQGRTHVMGVKKWDEDAQAKHIYKMALGYKQTTNLAIDKIYKRIAEELALDFSKVRDMVVRYKFYAYINEITDELEKEDWGFLESLDKTKKTREYFGLIDKDLKFEWEYDEVDFLINPYDNAEMKKELLMDFPKLVKKAKSEDVNTKTFRDTISKLINNDDIDLEAAKVKISDIANNISTFNSLIQELNGNEQPSKVKDEWSKKLDRIVSELSNFPVVADWTGEVKDKVSEINKKAGKILEFIDND